MIEQDAVARVETVAFALVHGGPIRENFRDAVRTARPERRPFILRYGLRFPEHLAARSLIETRAQPGFANRF